MSRKCIICNVKYSELDPRTFHRFPKDETRRKKWTNSLNLDSTINLKNRFVCSDHFEEKCFLWANNEIFRRRLLAEAIPRIEIFPRRIDIVLNDNFNETYEQLMIKHIEQEHESKNETSDTFNENYQQRVIKDIKQEYEQTNERGDNIFSQNNEQSMMCIKEENELENGLENKLENELEIELKNELENEIEIELKNELENELENKFQNEDIDERNIHLQSGDCSLRYENMIQNQKVNYFADQTDPLACDEDIDEHFTEIENTVKNDCQLESKTESNDTNCTKSGDKPRRTKVRFIQNFKTEYISRNDFVSDEAWEKFLRYKTFVKQKMKVAWNKAARSNQRLTKIKKIITNLEHQ